MLKTTHIFFVILSFVSFNGRFFLSLLNSAWLQQKWLKIAPHVIDTCLLLSGIALVFYEQWLDQEYAWIINKIVILIIYIGFGVMAMHSKGRKRWLAYSAAIICYLSILVIAMSKQGIIG